MIQFPPPLTLIKCDQLFSDIQCSTSKLLRLNEKFILNLNSSKKLNTKKIQNIVESYVMLII